MRTIILIPLILSFPMLLGFGQNPDSKITGNFIDSRDNHTYKWIEIGTQVWMAENLAYLPSVNRPSTESVTLPFYYVFRYKGTSVSEAKENPNYSTFGVLYNWEAAQTACPSGWHLPSDEEWKNLEKSVGMSQSHADIEGDRAFGKIGIKLKSTTGWVDKVLRNGMNGDNISGFNAVSGCFRSSHEVLGYFWWRGNKAAFWSSSEYNTSLAWDRLLGCTPEGVSRNYNEKSSGFSVRCLRD